MMASAAARKSFLNYFGGGGGGGGAERVDDDDLEADLDFDESDVWDSNTDGVGKVPTSDQGNKKSMMMMSKNNNNSRPLKKPTRKSGGGGGSFSHAANHRSIAAAAAASTSLPVNVPDWSRILGDEYKSRGSNGREHEDGEDDKDEDGKLPPHEYLAARTRSGWSFSVQEGIGRTLKGRDLSRVRNAVWKQTGFED
ncbi:uncharacterized protein [Coffea arabica]|uniref:Senescence regulator S40 n=1 Tax=Coffea arabica TaxID=13443 RepID=A0A6P6SW08_COFAR